MKKTKISVIGIGYVGLCTAVGFASRNFKVIASTHDAEKAAKINQGIPPFHEPHLKKLLKKTIEAGYLTCLHCQTETAVHQTDLTFNAMATPSKPDGSIDLEHIVKSTNEIGEALRIKNTYHVIVVKSTVVPGTTQNIVKPILEHRSKKRCGQHFGLCMNPEFLREGSALKDTFSPDRIIIGEHDTKSGDTLENLYNDFYGKKLPPTLRTNLPVAELIKYAANAFLATKISFINTMANICERIPGADVTIVAQGVGLDKRIGSSFLNAGLGYGGSCFPKDVKALISKSRRLKYNPELLESVEKVNADQPLKAVELCKNLLGGIKGRRISVLGLSFKPNTDDMREARSIPIVNQLLKDGAEVIAYDPAANPVAKTIFKNSIKYASSATKCLRETDCCILVTEWDEFRKLMPQDFKRNMRKPNLVDGRRIYDPKKFSRELKFAAIGLAPE